MNYKIITLSGKRQTQKAPFLGFHSYEILEKAKQSDKKQISVWWGGRTRDQGGRGNEETLGVMEVLYAIMVAVVVTPPHAFIRLRAAHFKWPIRLYVG
jgi:hypothetical protein